MDWSSEAFERAKKEQKPIVLDISASWCHWCHVMDKTTWSDKAVIEAINSKFIPIRVDTDKRPDVNDRYNQGGWPSVAFLSPNGTILSGGTYITPQDMRNMIPQVLNYFESKKEELLKEYEPPHVELHEAKHKIKTEVVDAIIDSIIVHTDLDFGGFGDQPKFPIAGVIDLLLLRYEKTKDDKFKRIVTLALDGMAGIHDKMDGGFYRYSVSRDWNLPHYEKMLDTNALILKDYLHGYLITQDKRYKDIIVKTVSYVLGTLGDERGPFYGSQDANEEYYKLDPAKRKKVQPPGVDKTFYTDANCVMISSLLEASVILQQKQLEETAQMALDFLIENSFDKIKGMSHYYDTKLHIFGQFSDNVYMIRTCLDTYDLTKDKKYLDFAERLVDFINKRFKEGPGYLDKAMTGSEIGALKMKNKDLFHNSIAADSLLRLHSITGKEDYKKTAEDTLNFFMDKFEMYGPYAAQYALAIERFYNPKIAIHKLVS